MSPRTRDAYDRSAPAADAPEAVLPLPASGCWDWPAVFGRTAPTVLEIGCGKGIFLSEAARARPERDYVGIEIRPKRVAKIAARIALLPNCRIIQGDAKPVLSAVAPAGLDAVWINFPDPWPKRAHAHRRLFATPWLLDEVSRVLSPGGELVIATDVAWYAAEILIALMDCPLLENPWGPGRPAPRPAGYPVSVHEEKFLAWGRPVYFLRHVRRG